MLDVLFASSSHDDSFSEADAETRLYSSAARSQFDGLQCACRILEKPNSSSPFAGSPAMCLKMILAASQDADTPWRPSPRANRCLGRFRCAPMYGRPSTVSSNGTHHPHSAGVPDTA